MKIFSTLPAIFSLFFILGISVPAFAHEGEHSSKGHESKNSMKHEEGSGTSEMKSNHSGGRVGHGNEYSEGSDSMNKEMGHKSHMGQSGEYKKAHENYEEGKGHKEHYDKEKSHHMREGS